MSSPKDFATLCLFCVEHHRLYHYLRRMKLVHYLVQVEQLFQINCKSEFHYCLLISWDKLPQRMKHPMTPWWCIRSHQENLISQLKRAVLCVTKKHTVNRLGSKHSLFRRWYIDFRQTTPRAQKIDIRLLPFPSLVRSDIFVFYHNLIKDKVCCQNSFPHHS